MDDRSGERSHRSVVGEPARRQCSPFTGETPMLPIHRRDADAPRVVCGRSLTVAVLFRSSPYFGGLAQASAFVVFSQSANFSAVGTGFTYMEAPTFLPSGAHITQTCGAFTP